MLVIAAVAGVVVLSRAFQVVSWASGPGWQAGAIELDPVTLALGVVALASAVVAMRRL
jgi:hypothetical protein